MRWVLIGASDIAATRMIPAMRAVGDEVIGVMSSSSERAAKYASENGLERATDSLDDALAWDADAVYISTTNQLHAGQALAAAAHGRHVLCEKPLAMTVADARAVIEACAANNVVLATNHHIRNNAVVRTIRDLVNAGEIGEVVAVRVQHAVSLPDRLRGWRLSDPAAGGGVIFDITVHDADTVRFVTGREVTSVTAVATSVSGDGSGVEDTAVCVMTLDGGAVVITHDSFVVPHAGTALEVHGTEGSILAAGAMVQDPTGSVTLRRGGVDTDVPVGERADLYQVGLRAFDAAVTTGTAPSATGADGLASLAIALAARASAADGRPVELSEMLVGAAR
ncbi:Gfo/Idh/MocA family protein [Cellulomonas sp.]|uniref:Gfo/Idh/MocA family protein n=1 Tax=Cellulomonas sp. TaxID=40001 RepID=UPI003BA9D1FE